MKTFRTFLRYFACYYFERTKILRFLINMCKKKNRFTQVTCIFIFVYDIFYSFFFLKEAVCAFPRYFILTCCRFSWLLVGYYEYLPLDFMDCFAITSTKNTVMTKTGNSVFSKGLAILILENKRKTEGISYTFVIVAYEKCLVSYVSKAGESRAKGRNFSANSRGSPALLFLRKIGNYSLSSY